MSSSCEREVNLVANLLRYVVARPFLSGLSAEGNILGDVPFYVSAETMRLQALDLLRDRINGSLGASYNIGYVAVLPNDSGTLSLQCFYRGDKLDEHNSAVDSLIHPDDNAWEYAGLVDCLIAHAAWYYQQEMAKVLKPLESLDTELEEQVRRITVSDRTVLDPEFLGNRLEELRKGVGWSGSEIEKLIMEAPVMEVKLSEVKCRDAAERLAVRRRERLLASRLKEDGVNGVVVPRVR